MKVFAVFIGILSLAFANPHHSYYDYDSGLAAITKPAVEGVVDPITTGLGKGLYGAAAGTQQTTDLLGGAVHALLNTLGGVLGQTEIGAGKALQNAAPAVQSTVSRIQSNSGLVGDVVRTVAGGHKHYYE